MKKNILIVLAVVISLLYGCGSTSVEQKESDLINNSKQEANNSGDRQDDILSDAEYETVFLRDSRKLAELLGQKSNNEYSVFEQEDIKKIVDNYSVFGYKGSFSQKVSDSYFKDSSENRLIQIKWVSDESLTKSEYDDVLFKITNSFGYNSEDVYNANDGYYYYIDYAYKYFGSVDYVNEKLELTYVKNSEEFNAKWAYCQANGCEKYGSYNVSINGSDSKCFCYDHSNEYVSSIENANKKSESKTSSSHQCEASGCTRDGNNSIIGLYGTTEYYCDEHFEEMQEAYEKITD